MDKRIIAALKNMNACSGAVEWVSSYKSPANAWRYCDRGDWMLWIIGKTIKTEDERKILVLVACQCARLSLKYVTKGETRPVKAIQAAEAWAKNKKGILLQDVKAAAYAAYVAYAAYAAYAAAYAAYAAADAGYAAAEAAGYATGYAAGYAAENNKVLKLCADIVRKKYPKPPTIKS